MRGSVSKDQPDAQTQVLRLLADTQRSRVLYDALELAPPSSELTLAQQQKSNELYGKGTKTAILVPNTRTAFLARLAFGQGNYRVVYHDLAEAVAWLARDGETTR